MFCNVSRVLAAVALMLGLLQLGLGVAIAGGFIGPYEQALARYSAASSSGEVINQAVIVIVLALALGTLAEIGIALRKAGGAGYVGVYPTPHAPTDTGLR